jgi:hypothetical protein
MEELVELILQINKEIKKELPLINHGGCGVFASKMFKKLKSIGYSPNIVILRMPYETSLEQKKEMLNNKMNKKPINGDISDTSFAHCCLEIAGLYFDSELLGINFLDRWERLKISGNYTIEELDLSLKVGSWNSTYNRRRLNPTVDKIIRKSVNKVFA